MMLFVSLYAQYVEAENLEKAMEKSDPRLYHDAWAVVSTRVSIIIMSVLSE